MSAHQRLQCGSIPRRFSHARHVLWTLSLVALAMLAGVGPIARAETIEVRLRYQSETGTNSGRFHRLERPESWDASKTAVIVCDMWDAHHCYRAVVREKEFAPRLNALLTAVRDQGATIIHAPSDCMDFYADHPARQRAMLVPSADAHPDEIDAWCHQIPAEEQGQYPIDQSDGGEDDTPEEHERWHQQLREMGRNPERPWIKQIDLIAIDSERDYISDKGTEVWNILEHHGIENVVLAGVHTNMCVLGRPFGLRRMVSAGKNAVLIRDLTDTMYNPASWPYVSHFTGTDLIIDHIERYVCPTISSDQILGGESFRFSADTRPHIAMIIGEPEYQTEHTLPRLAKEQLQKDRRISFVFASERDPHQFPGIELVDEADVVLLSVRRKAPPEDQVEVLKRFVADGGAVVGIRTANHAFALRGSEPAEGAAEWPELDANVFGGSYSNHYGADRLVMVRPAPEAARHSILRGIAPEPFVAGASLYQVAPLARGAMVLMWGEVEGESPEPVAWTFTRSDGGKSFYTSLGAPADFDNPVFQRLLGNALHWAAVP